MEEQRIRKIIKSSMDKLHDGLSDALTYAMSEGYKLGWEDCLKKCGLEHLIPKEG